MDATGNILLTALRDVTTSGGGVISNNVDVSQSLDVWFPLFQRPFISIRNKKILKKILFFYYVFKIF